MQNCQLVWFLSFLFCFFGMNFQCEELNAKFFVRWKNGFTAILHIAMHKKEYKEYESTNPSSVRYRTMLHFAVEECIWEQELKANRFFRSTWTLYYILNSAPH